MGDRMPAHLTVCWLTPHGTPGHPLNHHPAAVVSARPLYLHLFIHWPSDLDEMLRHRYFLNVAKSTHRLKFPLNENMLNARDSSGGTNMHRCDVMCVLTLLKAIFYVCNPECLLVCMWPLCMQCPERPTEGIQSTRARATGHCELPDVGAWN